MTLLSVSRSSGRAPTVDVVRRPQVGLLLIFLNEEARLRQAVEALIAERDRSALDIRIVGLDSGSTDRSLEILAEYDIEVHRIVGDGPRSVGAALYLGARCFPIETDYVQYVEADSTLSQGWLEAAVAHLERADPSVVGVKGRWVQQDRAGVSAAERRRAANTGEGPGGPSLLRRSALERFPYNPHLPGYADLDHTFRLEAAGRSIAFLDRPMIGVVERPMPFRPFLRKVFRRYAVGSGRALRFAAGDRMLQKRFARKLRRQLSAVASLPAMGVVLAGLWRTFGPAPIRFGMAAGGVAGSVWLSRGGRKRCETVALWVARTVGLVVGFVGRPRPFDAYDGRLDVVQVGNVEAHPDGGPINDRS